MMPGSAKKLPPMSEKVQFITISDAADGQRLDNFLITRLKGVPKSLIYRIIRKGEVRVNKGRAKPDRKLVEGDSVRIPPVRVAEQRAKPLAGDRLKQMLETAILFESPQFMCINKPSGLAVHGGSGISLGLIESLRQLRPECRFLELVHRLDRDTSGCVLVAKKRSMLNFLQDLFRGEKQIDKRYYALVVGNWPKRVFQVDAPLLRNELQGGERMVRVSPEGKPSKTAFRILQSFTSSTLVEASPITGRTHQIRVHAQYKGHPLVGDEKYGDDTANRLMKALGCRRLFLHARSLAFQLPDGESASFEAPLPDDLQAVLNKLE